MAAATSPRSCNHRGHPVERDHPKGGPSRHFRSTSTSTLHAQQPQCPSESARRITTWHLTLLPGLLQTLEYRRAMIWTVFPWMSTAEVEQRVEVTVKRQQRLDDPEFCVSALLSESVPHHQVGGPAVTARSLWHLAELGDRRNVSIRIVPHRVGSHLGLQTDHFVLLEFPSHTASGTRTKWIEPPVVYVEGFTGALYLERDTEVDRYRSALVEISRLALDEGDTRKMLVQTAKECAP
ncbi:DUF5753 domain-containing protein [Nocardia sp. NBC_01327]|uniref:DUF5753 domain-containing protein n=1 Tax=Nocardia sp. NBC_01327 TaxID=2903593 RepID=UPI002E11FBC6|nr:DUF5753 domain-containing protein [Nocardia sp. NBC_01327]